MGTPVIMEAPGLSPSEYVPEAYKLFGVSRRYAQISRSHRYYKFAEVTVRVMFPEVLPEVAAVVVVPGTRAVTRPLLLTVATDVLDGLWVTCVIKSRLVPS